MNRPPPQQEEEPIVPLTVEQARDRHIFVKSQIDSIRRYISEGKSTEEIQVLVPEFVKQFPVLFKKLTCGEHYNESSLRTLLAMLESMGRGDLSQHQASQIVGQRMVDTYIKPKLAGNGGGSSS
jgi:hypothetical protein